jgi:peptide/nickel transport system substrate-binding protein
MTEPRAASPFLPSQAGSDLLALFYEEPIERVNYRWEARLVERVPTIASGDVITQQVPVMDGMRYADESGTVHQHTGSTTRRMSQLVVTFTLQSDLRWSDGTPVTAKDAVLGYHLAQTQEARGRWRNLAERTSRFVAVDELRLRWEGIPGYHDTAFPGFLFPLQPAHRWQGHTLTTIVEDRTPPATGPFKITTWEAGRQVRLTPNPHYNGPEPTLKEIVVRFPQEDPGLWSELLVNGACDVILPDPVILTAWQQWAQLGTLGEAIVWADVAPVMLRLDLNLAPVGAEDSPVQDLLVRQALSRCIDRELLVHTMPEETLAPADSFIPPNHPTYAASSATPNRYDPEVGGRLLDRAGWRDADGDGLREAYGVAGFADGDPLLITLYLPSQYFVIAASIAGDLETCGVKANLAPMDLRVLYASDPASPLFGRSFEMALVGWQAEIPGVCGAWTSERIPNEENGWQGENFSGFTSENYDEACRRALSTVDAAEQAAALGEATSILDATQPSIFLAWRPFWFVARPTVLGLKPDASAYGTLWNAEAITIGEPAAQE